MTRLRGGGVVSVSFKKQARIIPETLCKGDDRFDAQGEVSGGGSGQEKGLSAMHGRMQALMLSQDIPEQTVGILLVVLVQSIGTHAFFRHTHQGTLYPDRGVSHRVEPRIELSGQFSLLSILKQDSRE